MKVARASRKGIEAILIGHNGHPEVEGTMGQYNNSAGGIYLVESLEDVWQLQVKNVNNLCFITQTTLSIDDTSDIIDALHQRFPSIIGPRKDDICYATTNRQEAVRNLTITADVVLVVGSKNSSNSNRLAELAQRIGKPAYLIDSANDIQESWLQGMNIIGVTAGASAPNIIVLQVISMLQSLGADSVEELIGCKENIMFEPQLKLEYVYFSELEAILTKSALFSSGKWHQILWSIHWSRRYNSGRSSFQHIYAGYQVISTDPSYFHQIVTLTYPHIGNTGINDIDHESLRVQAQGLVIRNLSLVASHYRSILPLSEYLKQKNVIGISEIDTRKLT
ncbi:hypothetical protein EPUL_006250, partial [Erysiphe pulchra]